jgi:hypothetical protein
VDDGGEKVTAGSSGRRSLSDVRKEMRITGAVTTSRLKQVVIEAVAHADQLNWRIEQLAAGFASLATVPAVKLTTEREGLPLAPRGLQHCPRAADRNIPGCGYHRRRREESRRAGKPGE